MNLTGKHASSITPAPGPDYPGLSNVSQSNLLSWAGTFGQGLTSLTKGKLVFSSANPVPLCHSWYWSSASFPVLSGQGWRCEESRPYYSSPSLAAFDSRSQAGSGGTLNGIAPAVPKDVAVQRDAEDDCSYYSLTEQGAVCLSEQLPVKL